MKRDPMMERSGNVTRLTDFRRRVKPLNDNHRIRWYHHVRWGDVATVFGLGCGIAFFWYFFARGVWASFGG